MGSFGDFGKREKKKIKQGKVNQNQASFSSKPVFVMPQVIKKDKKGE